MRLPELWMLAALATAGCAHASEAVRANVSPGDPPILPAPRAPSYALGLGRPRDPLVRELVEATAQLVGFDRGIAWTESLSGAAAGLALDADFPSEDPKADLAKARWAAICAGYPYPVLDVIHGDVSPATYPDQLAREIARIASPGDDLGVVRARVPSADRWVVVIGHSLGRVAAFPREVHAGDALPLSADRSGTWAVVSPTGRVQRGTLPGRPLLDEPGEWWVEIDLDEVTSAPVVSVPVYVDMATPREPLLDLPGATVTDAPQAERLAITLLGQVRDAFELTVPKRDPTLDTLARDALERRLTDGWDAAEALRKLRAAGFVDDDAAQLTCTAPTVARCIDQLMHRIEGRSALLRPGIGVAGVAALADQKQVTLVLDVADR